MVCWSTRCSGGGPPAPDWRLRAGGLSRFHRPGPRGAQHLRGLRTPARGVPGQPPRPHLALHADEEVQHTAVCEAPRVLTACLVEELLLQVHVVAPVSALHEDCLVEAGPQTVGQEGHDDQLQGDTPADGLEGGEREVERSGTQILYNVARMFQSLSLCLSLASFSKSIHLPTKSSILPTTSICPSSHLFFHPCIHFLSNDLSTHLGIHLLI